MACGFGHCRDPGLSCVRTTLWLVVCAVSLPRSGAVSGWSHPPIPLGLFPRYGGSPISWVFGRGFLVKSGHRVMAVDVTGWCLQGERSVSHAVVKDRRIV